MGEEESILKDELYLTNLRFESEMVHLHSFLTKPHSSKSMHQGIKVEVFFFFYNTKSVVDLFFTVYFVLILQFELCRLG